MKLPVGAVPAGHHMAPCFILLEREVDEEQDVGQKEMMRKMVSDCG
jgi:hypothetical protein